MYGVNVGCTGGCLGERLNGIQEVSGSIPLISTKTRKSEPNANRRWVRIFNLSGRFERLLKP